MNKVVAKTDVSATAMTDVWPRSTRTASLT